MNMHFAQDRIVRAFIRCGIAFSLLLSWSHFAIALQPQAGAKPEVSAVSSPVIPVDVAPRPTDADIFQCRIFSEPLVPIGGKATAEENAALSTMIRAYETRTDQDDHSAIIDFLAQFPKSPWRVALLTNLGLEYRQTGWFLKALDVLEKAWELGKEDQSRAGKRIVDRAVGELANLNARLGRREQVEAILKQIEGRPFTSPASESITGAREGVWLMLNRPGEAFKCGPYALDQILRSKGPDSDNGKIIQSQSTDHGMSLNQVWRLSEELGMQLQMARRSPGAPMLIPSVVNWKAKHYAALLKEDNGKFLVEDPTFGRNIMVTAAALEAESSGYFLVRAGDLPQGWHKVSHAEAEKVWGMGSAASHDEEGTKPCDAKARPDCNSCGMPVYNFHMQLVSLNIMDTPVGYTPPRGPDMHFTITYNQREKAWNTGHPRSNFGPDAGHYNWVDNWSGWLEHPDNTSSIGNTAVRLPGGGIEPFVPDPNTPDTYKRAKQSGAILKAYRTGSLITKFERHSPDGSRLIFGVSHFFNFNGSRRWYLTQWVDPKGQAITIHYDADFRLESITDALNQTTHITHKSNTPGPDYYLIREIRDPFNRFATFDYDEEKRLVAITDAIDITSHFTYSPGTDFIDSLTTPYGRTEFSQPASTLGNPRTLQAVDVDAKGEPVATERVEYGEMADVNPIFPGTEPLMPEAIPSPTPVNGYYNYRNSFYWNKRAMALYPPDANGVPQYAQAKMIHWLHSPALATASNIKEREKEPLENAIYYFYPGQTGPLAGVSEGTSGSPSFIARRLDDGSPGTPHVTQISQFEYDPTTLHNVTKAIDPAGRVTRYIYDTNNVDLLEIRQVVGANEEVLRKFTYNSPPQQPLHVPLTETDAAGQVTTFTYNPEGQLLARQVVRNSVPEITTYAYSDGSIQDVPEGYLASITSPDFNGSSAVTSFTYDLLNGVRTVTSSPDNYIITTNYDNLDRKTKITYPDTTFEEFKYTDNVTGAMTLDLTGSRDRLGRWTYRHYNRNRQMDSIIDPANRETKYHWCACGSLESIEDPNHNFTTFLRDIQHRVYQKLFQDNTTIDYLYEGQSAPNTAGATSRLKSSTDAKNQRTNYTYFKDNNIESITYTGVAGNPLSPPTPSVYFTYDPGYNRVATMTDGTGTTEYAYYPIDNPPALGAGKLHVVNGPLSNDNINYTYDELGRQHTQWINGATETIEYDSLGRLTTTDNALGHFERIYDGVTPRLQTLTYPNRQSASFTYFDNNEDRRLQTLENFTNGGTETLSRFDYLYDDEGQITNLTKTLGTTVSVLPFQYDDAKQLVSAGILPDPQYDFVYDSAGNRMSDRRAYGSGPVFGSFHVYTANDLNQTDTISTGTLYPVVTQGPPVPLSYDLAGNMTDDANGKTFEWDAANRLSAINYAGGQRTEFAYDGLGRRVKITEYGAGVTATIQPGSSDYDLFTTAPFAFPTGSYGLTFEGLNSGGNNMVLIDAVALNTTLVANGSFETPNVSGSPGSYEYNPSDTTWSFLGDTGLARTGSDLTLNNPDAPDGKQVAFVENAGIISQIRNITAGTYTLSFQAAQRADNTSSQQMRVHLRPSGTAVMVRNFIWCGNRICEERNSDGGLKRFFAEGEQRVGLSDAGYYYYTRDHLGSIREVTDSHGAMKAEYDYDPFGQAVTISGRMTVDFGYTGHYFHEPSGLNLAKYRAYSPTLGRWLSRDPLEDPEILQGPNLYAYVHNNPTLQVDSLGRLNPGYVIEITVSATAGAAVGGLPGAIIGGIAGAIIFAPATAQAPSPTSNDAKTCPPENNYKKRKCDYSCQTELGETHTLTEPYPGAWGDRCPLLRVVDPDTGRDVDCDVDRGPYYD